MTDNYLVKKTSSMLYFCNKLYLLAIFQFKVIQLRQYKNSKATFKQAQSYNCHII